ncbi:MAG TPA: extracellular solute-binding protein [Streptosporangiaceae bacterium]|jgi:multiple sugar transport system substrate-binding protein
MTSPFTLRSARRAGSAPRPRGHRRHWKALAAGCALAGAVTAISACGSGSGSGSGSGGHITLTELDDYPAGLPQSAAFKWLFSEYEKTHPDVTISRQSVAGTEILPKLLADAQTHNMPDIAVPDNPNMPNLAATGQFVNLNSDLAKWGQWNSYLAGSRAVTTVKGKTYGIEIGTNALGIIYNKKIFKEAGIKQLPTTWAQLLDVSRTIKSKVSGLTYGAIGFGAGCAAWQLLPWIYQQGLDVNDLTAPGLVTAVNYWHQLLSEGLANKEVITQCQSTNIPQLEQGKLAMVESGPWDFPTMAADHFTDFGTFAIPLKDASAKPSVPLGGEVWTVPVTDSKTEAAAWDFIKWSQQPSILLQFDEKLQYLAVRPALWPAMVKDNPKLQPFVDELKYAKGRTTSLGVAFNTYSNDMGTAVVQVLEGQKTAQAALSAAASAAKASLAGSGS